MPHRKIIYTKNPSSGSHFRQLGGPGPNIGAAIRQGIQQTRDAFGRLLSDYIQDTPSAPTHGHQQGTSMSQRKPMNFRKQTVIEIPFFDAAYIGPVPQRMTIPHFVFNDPSNIGIASLEDWQRFFSINIKVTMPQMPTFTIPELNFGPEAPSIYELATARLRAAGFEGDIPPEGINTPIQTPFGETDANIKRYFWGLTHDTGLVPGERQPGDQPKFTGEP